MSVTSKVDPNAIIRATDTQTLAPTTTTGAADHAKTDYIEVGGNASSSVSTLTVEAKNDNVTNVNIEVKGKGTGAMILGLTTQSASPIEGMLIYNSATNKLNFYNGSAWEVVTSV